MKKMYHATSFENLGSILEKGLLPSAEGIVYLTETQEEAPRFVAIRGMSNILIVECKVDESKIEEQFDHNENFFKCKAYGHIGNIEPENCINFFQLKL